MMKSSVIFLCTARLWLLCCSLPLLLASAHNTETGASAGAPSSSSTCLSSSSSSNNEHACVESSIPRGGGLVITTNDGVDLHTKNVILRFIESSSSNNKKGVAAAAAHDVDYPFHIQGWRWHFLSLIRDVKRLERLAKHLLSSSPNNHSSSNEEEDGFTALEQAANYAINFNMAGLFRIESNMFVPFLREHLCEEALILRQKQQLEHNDDDNRSDVKAVTNAFRKAVDAIDAHRVQSEKIGKILYEKAKAASSKSSTKSHQQKQQLLHEIATSSKQLSNHLSSMRSLQETLIVPAISRMVPPKLQKSFNNKVLLNLGILESRLHLVGMHDAVWELGVEDEKIKFEMEIPYVARMMIERWRQSLYIPKAGALDYGLEV